MVDIFTLQIELRTLEHFMPQMIKYQCIGILVQDFLYFETGSVSPYLLKVCSFLVTYGSVCFLLQLVRWPS
jgi:hypothetical protein